MESIDQYVMRVLPRLQRAGPVGDIRADEVAHLGRVYAAQVQSRHLDLAARWLQSRGNGHYTIGSAGHESNAAVGLLSRVDDPALLHYRSGAFYAARAAAGGSEDPIHDILLSLTSAASDPISGGRHKVFGHPALHIIPQTSTISSHLPRAVGLALSLGLAKRLRRATPWPDDALLICSFGDASANHSTALGAMNALPQVRRRVHRPQGCRVVRRRVTEAADDERILGPGGGSTQALGEAQ